MGTLWYHRYQYAYFCTFPKTYMAKSTFFKNKNFVFVTELNPFDSDFNCTTRKSTLSRTTVFLLQVMRLAKLNKPPLKSA